ncbi:hypothetical protein Tco_1145917 [Tanacetum coccineum]
MAPVESPQMISTVKLPMLKKGEYTLWSMRMERYLTNTYYDLWQVIINGDEPVQTTKDKNAVSNEDANQKFLRALPSSWNTIALIMRNKEGIDELDIDDLYNNLKVFEADIKGSSGSSSNLQNVSFLFAEDTNNINEVNTANGVSTMRHSSQGQSLFIRHN